MVNVRNHSLSRTLSRKAIETYFLPCGKLTNFLRLSRTLSRKAIETSEDPEDWLVGYRV